MAFYKEPASANATGATFKPVPLRSLVFDAKRKRHTRLIPGLPARGGLAIGQNLVDDEIPGQIAHRLAVASQKRDNFPSCIEVDGFAFMPKT